MTNQNKEEWREELKILDFPTAWRIANLTTIENHHEKCSYRQTKGAFLCDCVGMETARFAREDLENFIEQTIHQEVEKAVDKRVEEITIEIGKEILSVSKAKNLTGPGTISSQMKYEGSLESLNFILNLPSLQPTNNTKETK